MRVTRITDPRDTKAYCVPEYNAPDETTGLGAEQNTRPTGHLPYVINYDTLVLRMGTLAEVTDLASALFGRARRVVLGLLFTHADESFYLREIARRLDLGLGAAQREVQRLSGAGILRRTARGREVFYQANPDCPIFQELRGLAIKTAGVGDVLKAALAPLAARIDVALVYGSMGRGDPEHHSDVDILVVGAVSFAEVVTALAPAQETLAREINPAVYPPAEFRAKLAAGHQFLTSVLRGPALPLMGDVGELEGLVGERLAGSARDERAGDR